MTVRKLSKSWRPVLLLRAVVKVDNLDEVLELLKNRSRDYEVWAKEIGVHTCVNCKRYYSATEYGTDCPIMNVYAIPKDGYCHLWEQED